MNIVVMKFGGTSVADPEKIQRAAERAIALKRKGKSVAVVVSAPGEMTDELIGLALQLGPDPKPRELDALVSTGETISIALFALALEAKGLPAVSLTGPQAGFEAVGAFTRASIARIRTARIRKELAAGRIAVVAGFQAANAAGEMVTLGRGGSDLSAVSLAAALRAEACEIYTDVKGVYTADPRLVSQARLIKRLSYGEMLELSAAGAQVMLARSIEVARRSRVPVHVRSAFHPLPGTLITAVAKDKTGQAHVSSLALDVQDRAVKLTAVGTGFRRNPKISATLFAALAKARINIRMISTSDNRVSCVIDGKHGEKALRLLHKAFGLEKRRRQGLKK